MTAATVLVALSLVSTGLMAGLLYGWLVSVIPGTIRVDAPTYVTTMQRINTAIINPAFLLPFLGTPFLLAATAIVASRAGDQRRALALGGAAAVYLVGVLGVTMGGNVPLNDRLDRFDLAGSAGDQIEAMRSSYEGRWNRWHTIRTVASIGAFALVGTAALLEAEAA